jgi:hypothetical protein
MYAGGTRERAGVHPSCCITALRQHGGREKVKKKEKKGIYKNKKKKKGVEKCGIDNDRDGHPFPSHLGKMAVVLCLPLGSFYGDHPSTDHVTGPQQQYGSVQPDRPFFFFFFFSFSGFRYMYGEEGGRL